MFICNASHYHKQLTLRISNTNNFRYCVLTVKVINKNLLKQFSKTVFSFLYTFHAQTVTALYNLQQLPMHLFYILIYSSNNCVSFETITALYIF